MGEVQSRASADTVSGQQEKEATRVGQPFVTQWHRLVSTTNWEKGRIICQWRAALVAAGAAAPQYSDEAWSRRVGGVTGRHVGRLRRVWQRFGSTYQQYDGLYWSHFCAALDWSDAEMWLEGAVQSRWSVSQMRRQRWETLGEAAGSQAPDQEIVASEPEEEAETATEEPPVPDGLLQSLMGTQWQLEDEPDEPADGQPGEAAEPGAVPAAADHVAEDQVVPAVQDARPPALPGDLAAAWDAMRQAILRHKAAGWADVSADVVLRSLDRLRQLVLAGQDAAT